MKEENNNQYTFVVSWSQEYPELQDIIDSHVNQMLEQSRYKEANEVISNIKSKLKN
jgi:hypothetical protein